MHIYIAEDITDTLLGMADESRAKAMLRFFKTGKGDYGEGDKFAGLTNPQVRMVVKEAWRDTPLPEAARLVENPWHEVRLCGLLIMVEKYLRAMKLRERHPDKPAHDAVLTEIYETYLGLHRHIDNWDLVDLSAIKIVGNHQHLFGAFDLMDRWIQPGHTLWQRRIAMVSTWILVRKGRPEVALRRSACLLDNSHDLLSKATGWMLREVWKNGHQHLLRQFLHTHVKSMPAIMLSYACEQMPLAERHHWQSLRRP